MFDRYMSLAERKYRETMVHTKDSILTKTVKAEFNPKIPNFVDSESVIPQAETSGKIENKTKESIIDFFSKLVKQK